MYTSDLSDVEDKKTKTKSDNHICEKKEKFLVYQTIHLNNKVKNILLYLSSRFF